MTPGIVFALPNGRVVCLPRSDAQRIADRLWETSARPGAAVCATIIVEALRRPAAATIEIDRRSADALTAALAEL